MTRFNTWMMPVKLVQNGVSSGWMSGLTYLWKVEVILQPLALSNLKTGNSITSCQSRRVSLDVKMIRDDKGKRRKGKNDTHLRFDCRLSPVIASGLEIQNQQAVERVLAAF